MISLPIDAHLPEITAHLRSSRNLVLVAPPGAGKTTRVPPAILAARLLSADHPNLVMLQPRRVAARTVAERIADENGWELGREVGYHVRFDRKVGPKTRLRVLTEGILTRQLLDDPFLEGIGAVLLDEFHERSLFTDVAIALLKEVQQTVRPDLILMVMSATLEAEPVSKYLGDCPIVQAQGRTHTVEIFYELDNAPLPQRVAAAVQRVVDQTDAGDVLAFLPGAEEIRRAGSVLAHRDDLLVLPLYGALTPAEQNLALRPASKQKVILATNIAETSLTIDGVRTVVDSGFARVASYDVDRGMDRLDLQRISNASATQRAGRAGRTAPGRCVRLWPANEKLEPFDLPEVRRVDLAGTVLSLHAWGKPQVRTFGWYEPPEEETILAAEELLVMLGALHENSNDETKSYSITSLGKKLAGLPAHPRLARLLVSAAEHGLLHEGASLAALMAEKDIVLPGRGAVVASTSDLIYRLGLLDDAERSRFATSLFDHGVDPAAARQTCKTRDELLRIGKHLGEPGRLGPESGERGGTPRLSLEEDLLRLPLNAYPDRVCKRRDSDPLAGVMVGGGGSSPRS